MIELTENFLKLLQTSFCLKEFNNFLTVMNKESKGLATGVLLIVVMSVIVAMVAIFILATQTDFISNAALYLGNLLTIKTP